MKSIFSFFGSLLLLYLVLWYAAENPSKVNDLKELVDESAHSAITFTIEVCQDIKEQIEEESGDDG